jgi:hypothetical protein
MLLGRETEIRRQHVSSGSRYAEGQKTIFFIPGLRRRCAHYQAKRRINGIFRVGSFYSNGPGVWRVSGLLGWTDSAYVGIWQLLPIWPLNDLLLVWRRAILLNRQHRDGSHWGNRNVCEGSRAPRGAAMRFDQQSITT